MNGNCRYDVRGTEALACRFERKGERNLIDYDIARRSYEARQRLAKRQQRANAPVQPSRRHMDQRAHREVTLVDVVESAYTPNRHAIDSIADTLQQAKSAITSHPFWDQLRYGSLAGKDTGRMSYRQAFSTTTVCLTLSVLMVFLGS